MSSVSKLEDELTKVRNTLSADRLDMSFGELINMYDSEELIIDPNFQRLFRWDVYQRTRFIESILCGIPVPSIFVAEDTKGRWEVVDGLQRISTILSFFGKLKGEKSSENGWEMCEGDMLTELNEKKIDDLPLKLQLNIKRSAVRIEAIKWDSRYDMRYELFNRLNTGGSPLTDQEIRNCIFRGKGDHLTDEIKELAKIDLLEELVKPTERQKSQLYLDELVLRFYALLWIEEPKKNLGEHLTDYMREASENREIYNGNKELFNRTLRTIKNADVYKVFYSGNHQFSPSKYDGIMMGVSSNIDRCEKNPSSTAKMIKLLIEDKYFISASGVSSNYKERVKKRIAIAKKIFSNV